MMYGKLIIFFHFNVKHLGYDCEKSPDFWSAKVTVHVGSWQRWTG